MARKRPNPMKPCRKRAA
jgi:hypothetical protein